MITEAMLKDSTVRSSELGCTDSLDLITDWQVSIIGFYSTGKYLSQKSKYCVRIFHERSDNN